MDAHVRRRKLSVAGVVVSACLISCGENGSSDRGTDVADARALDAQQDMSPEAALSDGRGEDGGAADGSRGDDLIVPTDAPRVEDAGDGAASDGPLNDRAAEEDDQTVEEVEPADLGPMPPVAQVEEPAPEKIEKWLVAYVPDPGKDPVGTALDDGTFVAPAGPGKDAAGVEWYERVPEENGSLGYAGYGLFYAAAVVKLDAPKGIVVRADRFYQVYVNGAPQPGDPYMSRQHRTPAPGMAGDNVVVGAAYMALNGPELEIFTTESEVYFNAQDVTSPDLVVGQEVEQWLGIPLLNLTSSPLRNLEARVVGTDQFEDTLVEYPSLAPAAVTQLAFRLTPTAPPAVAGESWPVQLLIQTHSLDWSYETKVTVQTVASGVPYKRTRRSEVDNSVQYYGVNPPSGQAPASGHALVLSLHGAGVQAIGQAQAYGQKDWTYLVAATNRRPFGFDWEEWGRIDGIETLNDAMSAFNVDPTRVYVTGHSMGGHGTWQFGVHYSDRFRVVGPSAGWSSFYSYGGDQPPTGPFARARASSFTLNYVENLANRAVYVIHGDADDNVPISEAYLMADAVEPIADEFFIHVEPDAGHWWDGDAAPGADCVDWPPLFDLMKERTLDPTELDFTYRSPGPWVNGTYSYVSIRSELDPYEDSVVESSIEGDAVTLATTNVRSMVLDGAALKKKGVAALTVDGKEVPLADGPIAWGPQDGKTPEVHGPFNQVFHRPFCFVYDPKASDKYQRYVSFLVSTWTIIGNGHACAIPIKKLDDEIRSSYNIVYVGVPRSSVPVPDGIPFSWEPSSLDVAGDLIPGGTLLFVFPEEGHLSAAMVATEGAEKLLFWEQPFSSRSGLPDYVGWTPAGAYTAGFFDSDWHFDPAFGL